MKIINKNKEGLFNYQVLENFEAGVVLTGPEVKSVKSGQVSLKGSYIRLDKNNEAWLINCHISPYQPAAGSVKNYEPTQPRKLLLKKRELLSLVGKSKQSGLTIIPTSVYTRKRLIKVGLALAKGKREIDKRETIRKREAERQIQRTLKR
ncbi:MAG: SsrA-binding protein SmpB [Patescibacteria group bacterium]